MSYLNFLKEICTFVFRDAYTGEKTIKKITEMIIIKVKAAVSSSGVGEYTAGLEDIGHVPYLGSRYTGILFVTFLIVHTCYFD